jgi:hypothetical protein
MKRTILTLALLGVAAAVTGCETGYDGPPPGHGPGHHVRWCLAHHPDYNPNTNMFHDRFGNLRPCEHP